MADSLRLRPSPEGGVLNRFGEFALFGCKTASSGRGSVGRRLIREGLPSRDHRERLP
jgi:hypothetical protein